MSTDVFWFTVRPRFRAHAFELKQGELAEKSLCGDAELVDAADEPQREPIPPTVVLCKLCGAAEWAADQEYRTNRYHPEKGGPAMKKLLDVRKKHAKLFKDRRGGT